MVPGSMPGEEWEEVPGELVTRGAGSHEPDPPPLMFPVSADPARAGGQQGGESHVSPPQSSSSTPPSARYPPTVLCLTFPLPVLILGYAGLQHIMLSSGFSALEMIHDDAAKVPKFPKIHLVKFTVPMFSILIFPRRPSQVSTKQ